MAKILWKILRFLCITVAVCGLALLWFRYRYHAAIFDLTESQVRNATSDMINDAVDRQIEAGNIQYDRIVYFEKDLDGRITALKTNMGEVNRLKTDTLSLINEDLLSQTTSDLGIPLGSLIFPEALSGRGPEIPVQILAIRNSDASFASHFSEAGINQTLHQLTMEVDVDISVLVLGETRNFTVSSQVVVAETVIVGQVPDTFFQTGGQYGTQK